MKEMRRIADVENLQIVGTFMEAKSAKEPYVRTEFYKMISQIEAGKANGILVWKLDRLARNPVDAGTITHLLGKSTIERIRTMEKSWLPTDNVLLAFIEFGVATQYSRDLTQNVKRGLRASCEGGYRPSYAPLGYKNSRYHQKGKQEEILPDEERFFLVRKIFDYILSDKYTVSEVYRMANEESALKVRSNRAYSSKMMSLSYFFHLLKNPFYYGEFEYPVGSDNWYQGNHKPMITKDEYYRVQEIIGNKPRRTQKYTFAYTGILKCGECGGGVTAERKMKKQKNGNIHRYLYYHCTKRKHPNCSQKCISEKELEKQILTYLKDLYIPKELHEWALSAIEEIRKSDEGGREKLLSLKKKAYNDCENKIKALLEMRLNGELSGEEFTQNKLSLEEERAKLHSEISLSKEYEDTEQNKMKDSLSFAEKACVAFEKADMETKRTLFQSIGSNHLLKDKKLMIIIEKPFLLFSDMKKLHPDKARMLEPLKTFINKS